MNRMDPYDEHSSVESDESAEIQTMIAELRENNQVEEGTSKKKAKKSKRRKKPKQNSLDHLRERVTELMTIFEEHGIFIPPPESLSEKGKVWSSRIYGADKKRQRKNAERQLLEDRILQLEHCLREQHGIAP